MVPDRKEVAAALVGACGLSPYYGQRVAAAEHLGLDPPPTLLVLLGREVRIAHALGG